MKIRYAHRSFLTHPSFVLRSSLYTPNSLNIVGGWYSHFLDSVCRTLTSMRAAVVMTNIRLSDVDLAVDPPRPLKDEERDILAFCLRSHSSDATRIERTIANSDGWRGVRLRLPGLYAQFIVDESTPPIPEGTTLRVPVEAEAEDADGTPFLTLLFIGNDHRA